MGRSTSKLGTELLLVLHRLEVEVDEVITHQSNGNISPVTDIYDSKYAGLVRNAVFRNFIFDRVQTGFQIVQNFGAPPYVVTISENYRIGSDSAS